VVLVVIYLSLAMAQIRISRSLSFPQSCSGQNTCSLLGQDIDQNDNNLNQRLNTIAITSSASQQLQVTYTYTQKKGQGYTAQTQVNFVAIHVWSDANSNNVIDAGELGNAQAITAPSTPQWITTPIGGATTVLPFTVTVSLSNFELQCFIVKNASFSFPPDLVFVSGYGSYCMVQVTWTPFTNPTDRLALEMDIITNLPGGSVDDNSVGSTAWSITTPVQGYTMHAGGTNFGWKSNAMPEGHSTYDTPMVYGAFSNFNTNGVSTDFGLTANNATSFAWDIKFEPMTVSTAAKSALSGFAVAMALFVLLTVV